MVKRIALSLLSGLIGSACLSTPNDQTYQYACDVQGRCPSGQICVAQLCVTPFIGDGGDGGLDGGDAGADAGLDAGVDAGPDAGSDAGADAGTDAGPDAGSDAGLDAGADAGPDGGPDAGGPFDAGCIAQFQQALALQAGSGPAGIATGDFNRDGMLDLAVVDTGAGFTILQNRGGGQLSVGQALSLSNSACGSPSYPNIVVAGDYNGDGWEDLAFSVPDLNSLVVLLNELHVSPDAGFSYGASFELDDAGQCVVSSPPSYSPLVTVDLAAGWSLIALDVSGNTGVGGVGMLSVRDGGKVLLGTGAFSSFADTPTALAASRARPDGGFDLAVVASPFGSPARIDLFAVPAVGDPVSVMSSTVSAGNGTAGVQFADLNGDGVDDLLFVSTQDNTLTLAVGLAGGGFDARLRKFSTLFDGGGSGPIDLVVRDLDLDGLPDVATVNDHSVTLFAGDRDAGLVPRQILAASAAGAMYIVAGDFAADGGKFNGPGSLVVSYAPYSSLTAVDFFQTSCR